MWRGLAIGFALHACQYGMSMVTLAVWPLFFPPHAATLFLPSMFIGVPRLVYVVPAIVVEVRSGERDVAKGIAIAAALTLLMNVSCWGYFKFGR